MRLDDITHGLKVNWIAPARGGYGFPRGAAAVVERFSPKRVRIRLAVKRWDGTWATVRRSVKPESLSPRSEHVEAVDGVQ